MGLGMKDRILKGAEKLFYKHGYSGVRVDDIADFVGISKKTIYNHFPNKLALVRAVIEVNVQDIFQKLDEFTSDDNVDVNSIDKIHNMMVFGYQEIKIRSWMFTEDKKSKHSKDLIEEALERIRKKIIHMAGHYLEKGIKEGMFRPNVSKNALPYIIAIIVEGIFQLDRFTEVQVGGDELFKEAMHMIYEGILTIEGRKVFIGKWK
jgi:AcrR family transcriptional regulator